MRKELFLGIVLSTASAGAAFAEETVIPITPPGGTDLSQAILPPTGLYGALVAIPFNRNQNFYDTNGQKVPAAQNIKVSIPIAAAAFAYVYPFKVFDGSLATSVVIPFETIDYDIGSVLSGRVGGIGDIYSDLLFYSKNVGLFGVTPGKIPFLSYGLTLAGGLSAKFPTGTYNVSNPLNVGSNLFVVIPTLAATYTTGSDMSFGDSTEISARAFFGVPFKNPTTGYTSGNILDIDFSATQLFGQFRFGLNGVYQTQLSNDTLRGGVPTANGNKFDYLALGPIAEYITADGLIFKAKYTRAVMEHNYVDEQFVVLSVTMKLY